MKREIGPELDLRSLSELVYEDLKRRLNEGSLRPGQFIDLLALGRELGMSRTPLRDALIRLEIEGFVTVYPRRGVMVRALGLTDIRDIYQILGALEAQAASMVVSKVTVEDCDTMEGLYRSMIEFLQADDFPSFYASNLAFHDVYLDLCDNHDLVHMVRVLKERLYDFPRRSAYIKAWETASNEEHARIVECFRSGDPQGVARWIRDVHWSFEVQERYIRAYYFSPGGGGGPSR